jgi:PPOX class probable F420-dependent enzyme
MASMTGAERDQFLAVPRIAILATLRRGGVPVAVPVWFEWDGSVVRMFTSARSGKVARLQRDARASVLVANSVGEREAWVAFDGTVSISNEGAIELAERLAQRYWDMADPDRQGTLVEWRRAAPSLRLLALAPQAIRTSRD